jgi:hypothetical protein
VIDLAMEDKKDKLFALLEKVKVLHKLKTEDKELMGKPLMKRCMQVCDKQQRPVVAGGDQAAAAS